MSRRDSLSQAGGLAVHGRQNLLQISQNTAHEELLRRPLAQQAASELTLEARFESLVDLLVAGLQAADPQAEAILTMALPSANCDDRTNQDEFS